MEFRHKILNLKKFAESIDKLKKGDDFARGYALGIDAAIAVLYGMEPEVPKVKPKRKPKDNAAGEAE